MKKIVISCGPIPARVNSVKYITNRFKGGLAFRTANALLKKRDYEVTVVKWEFTSIPENCGQKGSEFRDVVNVRDVEDYYRWFCDHACDYDAFIMAAAVANLEPVNPWSGKFPSHEYQEGDHFPIEFKIAPRAIDAIKKRNPRACLIGYKLFDSDSVSELGDIAEKTLRESKANVIFANTPADAADWKLAVMQDGTRLEMSFEEHIKFIKKAIDAEFFRTEVTPLTEEEQNSIEIRKAFAVVEMLERTFPGHGTVAVPVAGTQMFATTARGHQSGPVLVRNVRTQERIVEASGKATLNASTLALLLHSTATEETLSPCDEPLILLHRHYDDPRYPLKGNTPYISYEFPGSYQEMMAVQSRMLQDVFTGVAVEGHGVYYFRRMKPVDWDQYYSVFPARYFSVPPEIADAIHRHEGQETLEIGGNSHMETKYSYDPYVPAENAINQTKSEVLSSHYDLVVAKNSINYLERDFIQKVMERTKEFIANTFLIPPEKKVTDTEAAVYDKSSQRIYHCLLTDSDDVMAHDFFAYTQEDYEAMGFKVTPYGKNSAILHYVSGEDHEEVFEEDLDSDDPENIPLPVEIHCNLTEAQRGIIEGYLKEWGCLREPDSSKVAIPANLVRIRECTLYENEVWCDNIFVLVDRETYEAKLSCVDKQAALEELAEEQLRHAAKNFLATRKGWFEICRSNMDFNWGDLANCFPLEKEGIFTDPDDVYVYEKAPFTATLCVEQDELLAPTEVPATWYVRQVNGITAHEDAKVDMSEGMVDRTNRYATRHDDECWVVLPNGDKIPCDPESHFGELLPTEKFRLYRGKCSYETEDLYSDDV